MNMKKRPRWAALVSVAALTIGLAACSSGQDSSSASGSGEAAADLTQLTFQLNSPGGGYNSGYALALEKGYYEDEGLDVTISPGTGSAVTAQLVAAGKSDIAFADAAATMKLVAEGAEMTSIGTILQGNPNEVTSLKETPINSIQELKGKKVALPNGYSQTAMFPLLLAANDMTQDDMEVVNMPAEAMVASLLQGQVDAILGSMDNFSVQLRNEGAEIVTLPFNDNGAATVAQSIVASDAFLEEHPDQVKAFMKASLKGWSDAVDDPKAALDALKKVFPDVKDDLIGGQLDATIDLMCANNAKFLGKATPEQWDETVSVLSEIGVLPGNISADTYYSYDYLPQESELRTCPLS